MAISQPVFESIRIRSYCGGNERKYALQLNMNFQFSFLLLSVVFLINLSSTFLRFEHMTRRDPGKY